MDRSLTAADCGMITRDTVADYNAQGQHYSGIRRADPAISAIINAELGPAKSVINVGAGTGSYEPADRYVAAVEPSATMRAGRAAHLAPALIGTADTLPYDENAFGAGMALLTVHHWLNPAEGLTELRRVASGPVLVMTFDYAAPTDFWLSHYVPEMDAIQAKRYPTIAQIESALGGTCKILELPVTRTCTDGFMVGLYARPEVFLSPKTRASQSGWSFMPEGVEDRFVEALAEDLESGAWDERFGHLRDQAEIQNQLRLIVSAS